ncbi:MAG TPA: SPASM domain-containing protein, partial [Candidatus Dormibacteraeota bacterium]|nr:SPASM domain-containing protein [Candidatus Dormibacteraeota bacterium]
MTVEVYSNLVGIAPRLWEVLERPGVRLATSYYSPRPQEHEAITGRQGSHQRTPRNLREALRRGIPVRAGAVAELKGLGVAEVRVDRMRRVGRGAGTTVSDLDQLCGHCGEGKLAISPEGEVWPCVFSRWLRLGNVRASSLAEVNLRAKPVRRWLAAAFANHLRDPSLGRRCDPDRLCRCRRVRNSTHAAPLTGLPLRASRFLAACPGGPGLTAALRFTKAPTEP